MSDLDGFLAARDYLLAHRTDRDTAYAGFRWPVLTDFNWASDYFDTIARDNDAPALHIVEEGGDEEVLSYADLSARSNQVANLMVALGLGKGDRVLVMLGNEVPLWETMLAATKLGAVMIPATTLLSGADLADRIDRGRVRMVVTNDTGAEAVSGLDPATLSGVTQVTVGGARDGWTRLEGARHLPDTFVAPEPTSPSDPLLEYFTSGTTATPKLVQHTHASYPVGHLSTMYWLGLQPGDVHWTISSPGWAKHAWGCFFGPFNAQACVFIHNYTRFHGPSVLEVLVRHRVTSLCAPPTVWRFLIQEDLAAHPVHLRELISAGEPLNPEVIERVRSAWDLTIRDGYGQTETTALVGNPPGAEVVAGSMGRPLPGYRIVLLGPDGEDTDEGEICIVLGDERPIGLMNGYADDPAKTDEVTRDGAYHTGDVGRRDSDGPITYVGRADDVFKASGYRISPFELESALIEHPAVAEAAVVPSPDPLRGFVPKAYVITAPGHEPGPETARSIFEFLRGRVAGYKMVRRLEFSDLPKTISGKIRRVELRGHETRRPTEGARSDTEYLEESFRD